MDSLWQSTNEAALKLDHVVPRDNEVSENVTIQMLMKLLDTVITPEVYIKSLQVMRLRLVKEYAVDRWPQTCGTKVQRFFNIRDDLAVWNMDCLARDHCAIVPKSLRSSVLDLAHEGHLEMVRMKQS